MPFARVDHQHALRARRVEHALARRDDRLQRRDVVAERFAEAAGLDEVALHVDDEERGRCRDRTRIRTARPRWFSASWCLRRLGRVTRPQCGQCPPECDMIRRASVAIIPCRPTGPARAIWHRRGGGCRVQVGYRQPRRASAWKCRPASPPSCSRTSRAAPACGSRKASAWPRRSAQHDARARAAVEGNRGIIVKTTGDGLFAAFDDPLDAVNATVMFQQSLVDPAVTNGIAIRVRCGLHLGVVERRDNDYFGTPVNRTARIMSVAHGGQILLSQAVVDEVGTRLPAPITLRDLGSVRLKDLSSPEHVYQVVHPGAAAGFPGAALARGHAQQPAAAAHVVHRARARARRGDRAAEGHAPAHAARHGRPRQDAAVAADRRRHAGRVSRRRLVPRSRADPRSVARAERGGAGARRARGAGQAAHADAVRAPQVAQGAADLRQLRAAGERLRDARQRAAAGGARHPDHRLQPRGAARPGRADLSGAAAGGARAAPRASRPCRARTPCSCSWRARSCRSPASR